tara:strand:- start:1293 stop:1403 length:111 start_codon:yes stop_codon:yes gene_type:complete
MKLRKFLIAGGNSTMLIRGCPHKPKRKNYKKILETS